VTRRIADRTPFTQNVLVSRLRPSGPLDWTFEVALILKGLDGLLEIFGGAVLLLLSKQTLNGWLVSATEHELSEDPHDFLYTHVLSAGQHLLATSQLYAALYLVSHGVVKVVLVVAVLRDKLWAYPWMVGFLILFIGYQSYLFAFSPSMGLALLTVFDVFIVWLTYREYGRRRSSRRSPTLPAVS
jgi:uncharacterized membrane protein